MKATRLALGSMVLLICLLLPFFAIAEDAKAEAGQGEVGAEVKEVEKEAGKLPWWVEHLDIYGDVRLRYEMIKQGGKGYRNRARLRARLGLTAHIVKTLDIGIRIATGDGDPVSTNITLGDGFSKKFIHLDMAYFDWMPVEKLSIKGGKFQNPFYRPAKSELIWDADLPPDGMAVQYEHAFGPLVASINTGGFWVNESSTDDTWLLGGQGLLRYDFIEDKQLYVLIGASYYYYTELRGKATLWDPNDSYGNSVDAAGRYLTNFRELEGIFEVGGKKWDMPMAVFGQYVINTATSSNRQGWMAGFYIGNRKKPFRPAFRYDYRWIQSNAAVGLFTDSDFCGGDVDGKGHEFNLDIPIHKNMYFEITYFLNTRGLSNGVRYQRVMADFNVKF